MINVTLKYGMTRELRIDLEEPITVGEILDNPNYRASIGLPENVVAVIDGETVGLDHYVNDGDVITFEKQAATKAA
jgi:hypothetical protein